MRLKSKVFSVAIAVALGSVSALTQAVDVRKYAATQDNSVWTLATASRLECRLTHQIPRYGQAHFSTIASKEQNLDFELDMLRMPENYGVAAVKSVAPSWRPGAPGKDIVDVKLLKQFNPGVPKDAAWTMINELDKGFMPTIYYKDWNSQYDRVVVGLSSVNFRDVYDQFLGCVDQLLPYSFEDISYTVLNYQSNSDELTRESQKRLMMIGEYIKNDPDIEAIDVDAFTDSYGGRYPNLTLSRKRAKKIKDFLVEMGVQADRISVTGFGEKRHVASNQTELGRAKNRRVVIRMARVVE